MLCVTCYKREYMFKSLTKILFIVILGVGLFGAFDIANAETTFWSGSTLSECRASGDCSLNDFVQFAINIVTWIYGIVGSLALLYFVYGGFTFLISAGKSEEVNKGKDIIKNAVIGIIIIFTSWIIINFVLTTLGYDGLKTWDKGTWTPSGSTCPSGQVWDPINKKCGSGL